jgi:hypothetical protein
MNWETYKGLSRPLKDEYDIRFRHRQVPNASKYIWVTILFICIASNLVFTSYLAVTDERFEPLKETAFEVLQSAGSLMKTGLWIIIAFALYDLIGLIIFIVSYEKWKKNHNIKIESKFIKKVKEWLLSGAGRE